MPSRTTSGPISAAAFATRDRDVWVAELAGADTCVSPVLTVAELVDDDQYGARRAIVDAVVPGGARADGAPASFRQVGPVLAGMAGAGETVVAGDPARSDTDALLAAAGVAAERIAELRTKGVVA